MDYGCGMIYGDHDDKSLSGYLFDTADRKVSLYIEMDQLQATSQLQITTYLIGTTVCTI